MKELVIISGKGGTGKTSVTSSFASLAENVVIADCDVDAADLHLILQPETQQEHVFHGGKVAWIDPDKCSSCGICRDVCRFDAITPEYRVVDYACEGCGVCVWNCPDQAITFEPRESGDWFISRTRRGMMVHAKLRIAEENSGKLVTLVRKQARELANRGEADLILVDGPPGVGCPVIASIGGADLLLVVAEPSKSAIHDMERVIKLAEHFRVPAAVCINKYDINTELTQSIESYCQTKNIPVVGWIPFDRQFTEAMVAGKSIVEYANGQLREAVVLLWKNIKDILQRMS